MKHYALTDLTCKPNSAVFTCGASLNLVQGHSTLSCGNSNELLEHLDSPWSHRTVTLKKMETISCLVWYLFLPQRFVSQCVSLSLLHFPSIFGPYQLTAPPIFTPVPSSFICSAWPAPPTSSPAFPKQPLYIYLMHYYLVNCPSCYVPVLPTCISL